MEEGVGVQMPSTLRCLFATLLIFYESPNAKQVWSEYYTHLLEDFQYTTYNNNEAWILHKIVTTVQKCLEVMEKSLADFNLSELLTEANSVNDWAKDVKNALVAPILENLLYARKKLNLGQKLAYREIMHHIKHKKNQVHFL